MSAPTGLAASLDVAIARDDTELARATMRRVSVRLLPLLFVVCIFNMLDRSNIAMASLQMNRDLRLSATAYGFGAAVFFVGYAVFEVPSNLILARVGARRWIARIVISWGIIAAAMMFVRTPAQFYSVRFLLGVAEAGFWPGIIYFFSLWFPSPQRARATSRFFIASPLSVVVGNPLGGWLLGLEGHLGLHGWQWIFLVEGIPSVLLGLVVLAVLTDRPEQAHWLSGEQRDWLVARLQRDQEGSAAVHGMLPLRALAHPMIWLGGVLYFLIMVDFTSYVFWSPHVVQAALRATPLATGFITAAIAGVAALGMLALGASSDRTGDRSLHMTGAATLAALGYVGAVLLPVPLLRVACLVLVLAGSQGYGIPFWCLPSMILRGSAAAAAIAFMNSLGQLGGFVGPYLTGWLVDVTGSTSGAFLVLAGVALTAAALSLVMRQQELLARYGSAGPSRPAVAMASGRA